MSRNLSPDEVCHRLVMFLAVKGLALSKADQAEIQARVLGHRDAAAKVRYDQNAQRFQVYELSFEDLDSSGNVELKDTLSRMPLDESTSVSLARVMAQQAAALRGRPCVLCDGNFENVEVVDEENPPEHAGFSILQVHGTEVDSAVEELDDDLVEQCDQHGARSSMVRGAVASAKACMESLLEAHPSDETVSHLVLVADNETRKVIWRLHR